MKLLLVTTTAIALIGLAAAQPARAADSGNPLSVSVGVHFPSQSAAQRVGGTSQFAANLSYAVSSTSPAEKAIFGVFLDYTTGGNNGANEHSFGGGIGLRSAQQTYVGADVGVYSSTVSVPAGPGTFSRSTTSGGGRVYLGANLSRAPTGSVLFAEAGYRVLPSVAGVNPSGFGVSIGGRF